MDWGGLAKALSKVLIPVFVPGGAAIADIVGDAITQAEAPATTGAAKLQTAIALTNDGIAATNAAAQAADPSRTTPLIDPAAANLALASGISAVVNSATFIQKLTAHPAHVAATLSAAASSAASAPVAPSTPASSASPTTA